MAAAASPASPPPTTTMEFDAFATLPPFTPTTFEALLRLHPPPHRFDRSEPSSYEPGHGHGTHWRDRSVLRGARCGRPAAAHHGLRDRLDRVAPPGPRFCRALPHDHLRQPGR